MSLSATTQGFLKEVESSTGFKVLVEEQGSGLQVPLLAKVQVARRGMPFHRVVYHPSAGGMADYLVCYHCAFILRLHCLPAAERFNLADNPVAEEDCLKWTRAHEGSDPSDADRQTEVAGFLRTALMTMVRSVPVGIWVDQDLRARFPDLRAAQEQGQYSQGSRFRQNGHHSDRKLPHHRLGLYRDPPGRPEISVPIRPLAVQGQ